MEILNQRRFRDQNLPLLVKKIEDRVRYHSRWLYLARVTLSGRDEFLSLVGR